MRFLNKYKLHQNLSASSKKLPLRIQKFNRPKWNLVKKKFTGFRRKNFLNIFIKNISVRSVGRLKRYHKTKLQLKWYLLSLFDNSVLIKSFKNVKLRKDLISLYFVKPLYRVDILIWYLNYFASSFEAKQCINSKIILINGKSVKSNYHLKKGDIISFKKFENFKQINNMLKISQKYLDNNMYFSFLEVDYYSNIIIVIKNFDEIMEEDLQLLVEKNVNIKHLLNK